MTAVENAPELDIRSYRKAELIVCPSDITFHDLSPNTIEIRVEVRNEGERRSSPTLMRLESAPFGAFVPSRPLAVVPVPSLDQGEARVVRVEATRPHPKPLGYFDGVPPISVLTALSASPDDPAPQPASGFAALLNLIRRPGTSTPAGQNTVTQPSLPPDLWEFCGREQPHWAGNVNVFVGDCAVERHRARALRIYAGRTNLAMFIVGGPGERDAYAFNLVGLAPDWNAALYDGTNARTIRMGASDTPIQEGLWKEARMMVVLLAMRPPVGCKNGTLAVHVTRRSSGKSAVVEFDLDPTAQGPGCYVA